MRKAPCREDGWLTKQGFEIVAHSAHVAGPPLRRCCREVKVSTPVTAVAEVRRCRPRGLASRRDRYHRSLGRPESRPACDPHMQGQRGGGKKEVSGGALEVSRASISCHGGLTFGFDNQLWQSDTSCALFAQLRNEQQPSPGDAPRRSIVCSPRCVVQ
jgi:hypothetical protein